MDKLQFCRNEVPEPLFERFSLLRFYKQIMLLMVMECDKYLADMAGHIKYNYYFTVNY